MNDKNKQKAILITGASSGIGEATALYLQANGYRVYAGIRTNANPILENPIYIDITKNQSIKDAYKKINAENIELISIINNAGIAVGGAVECLNIDNYIEQFNINTFGAIRVVQEFMPLIRKHNTKIINISSMSSYLAIPFLSPYCASKKALDTIFKCFEYETGIKTISIKPGVVKTNIWTKSTKEVEKYYNNISIDNKQRYKENINELITKAKSNKDKGLNGIKVAKLISKVLEMKNPKSSYTVGHDSFKARLASKLPQSLLDFAIMKLS